jgi:gliding motility-associated-like protein
MVKKAVAALIFFLTMYCVRAQTPTCSNIGQTPSSAFPVCGTSVFTQNNVPICGTVDIPVPCNDGALYQNKNPYWYKFTCYTAGTLGFVITPNNSADDYDWQLFDVTNHNPNDVFTDQSLFVACNWSGFFGTTGASTLGNSLISCAGNNPIWSRMPNLIAGHNYILLISHFTNSQSGYVLEFTGGTAVITDPLPPQMSNARITCDGTTIILLLNKKMKCNSLAADGSDFTVGASSTIQSATAPSCTSGFDMDSVLIKLNTPLSPGNYSLIIQNGSDGNTLLDNCGTAIPAGDNVPFSVTPQQPTPFDSIKPVGCAPTVLNFVFKRPVQCNSVATDGSDFTITGPQAVTVTGVATNCTGTTTVVSVQLSSAIVVGGSYQVMLRQGTDGNTITDECGRQTPAGSTVTFITKDTVSADFTYTMQFGCKNDTLNFSHDGAHGVTNWIWTFDNAGTSNSQNVTQVYSAASQHNVKLFVTNGVCSDSTTETVTLDNKVIAAFEAPDIICPEDSAIFMNKSTGIIDSWKWTFGNGNTSILKNPPAQHYSLTGRELVYRITLIASSNTLGCQDSISHTMRVLGSCYIAVPSAFTPNGDGLNDFLYPLNALKADNLQFRVFNRWGQVVFETRNWQIKWDGSIKGVPQQTGVYVWYLSFVQHDTGKKVFMKGTTTLIR